MVCGCQLLKRQNQSTNWCFSQLLLRWHKSILIVTLNLHYSTWVLKEIMSSHKYSHPFIFLSVYLPNTSIKFKQTESKTRMKLNSFTELAEHINWILFQGCWNLP